MGKKLENQTKRKNATYYESIINQKINEYTKELKKNKKISKGQANKLLAKELNISEDRVHSILSGYGTLKGDEVLNFIKVSNDLIMFQPEIFSNNEQDLIKKFGLSNESVQILCKKNKKNLFGYVEKPYQKLLNDLICSNVLETICEEVSQVKEKFSNWLYVEPYKNMSFEELSKLLKDKGDNTLDDMKEHIKRSFCNFLDTYLANNIKN